MKQEKNVLCNDDLTPLLYYIHECHEGDLLSFSNSLDKTIFMFHFLAQDTFTEFERQNCCHVLMELKEAIIKVYNDTIS